MKPGLYIIATPIGNLKDITLRAIDVMKEIDIIYCEDTRKTAILLDYYQIKKKRISYNEHNRERRIPEVLRRIKMGEKVGFVCDSGTPAISDPGYKLIQSVIKEGLYYTYIPGPTSIISALILSGAPTDSFIFEGFVPKKKGRRKKVIEEKKEEKRTIIFFESPKRLYDTLGMMFEILGDRKVSIVREITKIYEEVITDTLSKILNSLKNRTIKGEVVIVLWGKNV